MTKINEQALEAAMTNQRDSFEKWNADTKDCGHDVQPNSATARVRYQGWKEGQAALIAEIVGEIEKIKRDLSRCDLQEDIDYNDTLDKAIEIVKGAGV